MENNDEELDKLITKAEEIAEVNNTLINTINNGTEKDYVDTNITPLLSIMNLLANVSSNLSSSVDILQSTYVVKPKKSELKDTIDLMYNINEKCEDIYDVLKKRIRPLLHENIFTDTDQ